MGRHPDARDALARAALRVRRNDLALGIVREVLAEEEPSHLAEAIEVAALAGEFDLTDRILSQLPSGSPNRLSGMTLAARAAVRSGHPELARLYCAQVEPEIRAGRPDFGADLAGVYIDLGDCGKAASLLDYVEAALGGTVLEDYVAPVAARLGDVARLLPLVDKYSASGRSEASLRWVAEACRIAGDQDRARELIIRALPDCGEPDALEIAVRVDPAAGPRLLEAFWEIDAFHRLTHG
jgi:hypothetical protein